MVIESLQWQQLALPGRDIMALLGLLSLLLLLSWTQALDLGYGGLPGQRTAHTGLARSTSRY